MLRRLDSINVADQSLPSAENVSSTDEHDPDNIQVISSSKKLRCETDADNSPTPFNAESEMSTSNVHIKT
ncbi:hypothetical protein Lalb_Chr05g0221711 [Lupinus albus]|uniref:Uncharacterized protein n=1 Tax=Lupinus albus TaxID=3870 RepID=A0A6A4QHF6_LUPAL|nr:hypothetical protein Lalb_Chr05g0221711 [Lupinus albus]